MNFQKGFKKRIVFMLIVSILSMNLTFLAAPKRADAALANSFNQVWDTFRNSIQYVWEHSERYLQISQKKVAHILAMKLIAMVSRATVEWINTGFNGSPAYVADVGKFLTGPGGIGDQVVGEIFATNSNLSFLCDPFKIQVKLALQLSYGYGLQGIGCTLTQISRNVNAAANTATVIIDLNGRSVVIDKDGRINGRTVSNFTRGGGWHAWLKNTLQPQNSPVGAYLIAKADMDAKIATAQETKKIDLLNGQGALSYKVCVDNYTFANGDTQKSREYIADSRDRPAPPKNVVSVGLPDCATRTPGSIITAKLQQKATTQERQAELATLSDGLDQIFGALIGAAMAWVLDELECGVLCGNTPANAKYNAALGTAWTDSINEYNKNINDLSNEQIAWNNMDWGNPDVTIPTTTAFTVNNFGPLVFSTSTTNWFSTSTPSKTLADIFNNTPDSAIGTISDITFDSTLGNLGNYTLTALDRAKNNASSLINSLLKSEKDYQNTHLVAQNVLTSGKDVFSLSSACNIKYNRIDTNLRSALIRSNVITNIEGKPDSERIIASIPWNFKVITAALENSNGHIILLDKALNAVRAAGNITAVSDAMIPVNSTSFNTDPQVKMVENIKTWLRGVRNMYNSLLCPIDLTKTLQITTSASTQSQTLGGSYVTF